MAIVLCKYFKEIFTALENISLWPRSNSQMKALSLLKSIMDSEFIITTFILSEILGTTLPLNRLLQSPKLDGITATKAFNDTISVLEQKRQKIEEVFHNIFKEAQDIAKEMNVDIVTPRLPAILVFRTNYPNVNAEHYFRISTFIPILNDLKDRFSEEVLKSYDLRLFIPNSFVGQEDIECAPKNINERLTQIENFYQPILANGNLKKEFELWATKWHRVYKDKNDNIPTNTFEVLDAY